MAFILRGGGGYQINSKRASLLLGLEYKGFTIGTSYDFTLSQQNNDLNNRTIEITISYIGQFFRESRPPAVIFCPQY